MHEYLLPYCMPFALLEPKKPCLYKNLKSLHKPELKFTGTLDGKLSSNVVFVKFGKKAIHYTVFHTVHCIC